MMRRYCFFFHYNKPASQQKGRPQASVHFRGACHVVDEVNCQVPTRSRVNRRQPYFVMTGRASELIIEKGIAILK